MLTNDSIGDSIQLDELDSRLFVIDDAPMTQSLDFRISRELSAASSRAKRKKPLA
jgi:hypothetical protein